MNSNISPFLGFTARLICGPDGGGQAAGAVGVAAERTAAMITQNT